MINNITIKNNVKIIDNKYVIKKKKSDISSIYHYLLSRSFDYFPKIIKEDDNNIYYEYIADIKEPNEQKIIDMITLLSLLHNKTSYYKEVDLDYYKDIYEKINKRIDNTYEYYNRLMDNIESEIYMSPANYLIARNISLIYDSLNYAKREINAWYKQIENKRKVRLATIHNNLTIDHYLKNSKPYFISWDNVARDMPLYDLVKLYQRNYLDYEFIDILRIYFSKYPYSNEEMTLFLTILSIPDKIKYAYSEYKTVLNVRRTIDYIYKTRDILTEYRIKQKEDKS